MTTGHGWVVPEDGLQRPSALLEAGALVGRQQQVAAVAMAQEEEEAHAWPQQKGFVQLILKHICHRVNFLTATHIVYH